MTTKTDITLPQLPRLQVPRIDADIDLMDIRRLVKWAEDIANTHARAAVEADRKSRGEPVGWLRNERGEYEGPATLDPLFVLGGSEPPKTRHGATYMPLYSAPQPAEPVNVGWCEGCTPDNCTGCGPYKPAEPVEGT